MTSSIVGSHLSVIRKAYGKNGLPFLIRREPVSPQKMEKIFELIATSKKIIERKATALKSQPRSPLSVEKRRGIAILLKQGLYETDTKIAEIANVAQTTVSKHRKKLVELGEIPEVSTQERVRHKWDKHEIKTTVLHKKERQALLKPHIEEIRRIVYSFHRLNIGLFDFLDLSKEQVFEAVFKNLDNRMRTFDPKNFPQWPEKKRFLYSMRVNLMYAKAVIRFDAWKKYQKKPGSIELEQELKSTVKPTGKKSRSFEGLTVQKLEQISSELKLTAIHKAVLFGLAAGILQVKIARELRVSKSNITHAKRALEKRITKMLAE